MYVFRRLGRLVCLCVCVWYVYVCVFVLKMFVCECERKSNMINPKKYFSLSFTHKHFKHTHSYTLTHTIHTNRRLQIIVINCCFYYSINLIEKNDKSQLGFFLLFTFYKTYPVFTPSETTWFSLTIIFIIPYFLSTKV